MKPPSRQTRPGLGHRACPPHTTLQTGALSLHARLAVPTLTTPASIGYPGEGQPAASSAQGLLASRIMFPGARLTPEAKPRGGAEVCDATLTPTSGHAQGTGTLPAPHPSEDSASWTLTLQGPTLFLQSGRCNGDGADTEGPGPPSGEEAQGLPH